ncbi:Signal peptide peptidase-like 3, partial [Mucuna pruriens]
MASPSLAVAVVLLLFAFAAAEETDKIDPSCDHDPQLVKVMTWVDGKEDEVYGGMSAKFGSYLPPTTDQTVKYPAVFSRPMDCCVPSINKLYGSVALCKRGTCDFTIKASVVQLAGASGALMINGDEEVFAIRCPNDTRMDLSIPIVEIPKSTGDALEKILTSNRNGIFQTWIKPDGSKLMALCETLSGFLLPHVRVKYTLIPQNSNRNIRPLTPAMMYGQKSRKFIPMTFIASTMLFST